MQADCALLGRIPDSAASPLENVCVCVCVCARARKCFLAVLYNDVYTYIHTYIYIYIYNVISVCVCVYGRSGCSIFRG